MAKQTFTTGQVLTAAQVNSLQTNDFNQTVNAKTASYVLVASDKGTRIEFNTSGSVTCTVNTGLFDAGDTLIVQNRGAGAVTITAGTATVNTGGSLVVNQYESGTLYFISASAALWFGSNPGDITGVTAGTGISGGGTSGTVTITNSMATEITAAGDIIVGTGSGTFDNLPIGTTGQVLTADTTVSPYKVKWASASSTPTFVGVAAYLATTTAIANATETNISWTEYLDSDGFHSDSTNPTRFTVPSGKAGKYEITRFFHFQPNGSGQRYSNLKKNGTNAQSEVPIITVASSGTNGASKTDFIDLAVGDYIEVSVVQSSGGNLNLYGNNDSYKATAFTMVYLGA